MHTQGIPGTNGQLIPDLAVVRVGVPGGRKDSDGNNLGLGAHKHKYHSSPVGNMNARMDQYDASQIQRVVEKLSLDYLVEEKK